MTTEERRQSLAMRSIVILNAGCMPGDLAEDGLDIAEAAIVRAEGDPSNANKEALKETFSALFHSHYERQVRLVNEPLLPLGRLIIPTYIQTAKIRDFETLAREWQVSLEARRADAAERLFSAVGVAVTAPHYRAMHVYQAMRVPKAAAIAHYLEKAAQLFYAQDYFSSMLVLLPAVEKLILFHIGHLTDDLVTTAQMRAQIRASTSTTEPRLQPRYEIYKEFVLHFIQRFQQRASVAAGSVGSNIFRNRIYHVASDDPFYTYAECVTLFCFFDAYVQLLALEDNCELYGLVPDNDEIRARSHGYVVKIFDNYVADDNYDEEQMIAAGPSYYRPEVTDRNYIELLQAGVAQKAFVLQFLLRLGSEKVAVYADRAARIKKSGRAAIITTGINDYKRYHELGMGGFS